MATLIPAGGGENKEVLPHTGEAFTLQELQHYVGGYIEVLRVGDDHVMFLNEEGKLRGLPYNQRATLMMRGRITDDDYIVGNVIVCTRKEAGEGSEPEEEV